eukprot:Colp12_sorted_trinity150504_noHs@33596
MKGSLKTKLGGSKLAAKLEGLIDLVEAGACALCTDVTTTALAPEHVSGNRHPLVGLERPGLVLGDLSQAVDLAGLRVHSDEQCGALALLERCRHRLCVAADAKNVDVEGGVGARGHQLLGLLNSLLNLLGLSLLLLVIDHLLQLLKLLLQHLLLHSWDHNTVDLLVEDGDLLGELLERELALLLQLHLKCVHKLVRLGSAGAGECCEAADALSDGLLAHDRELLHVSSTQKVGATAELDGCGAPLLVGGVGDQVLDGEAHAHNTHRVGVHLPEHGCYLVDLLCSGKGDLLLVDDVVAGDELAHELLNLGDLSNRERTVVGEVEAEAVRVDDGALLGHLITKHAAERKVRHVRRSVVVHRRPPLVLVDESGDSLANLEGAGSQLAHVEHVATVVLGILNNKLKLLVTSLVEEPNVERLTALLSVEVSLVEHDTEAHALGGSASLRDEVGGGADGDHVAGGRRKVILRAVVLSSVDVLRGVVGGRDALALELTDGMHVEVDLLPSALGVLA